MRWGIVIVATVEAAASAAGASSERPVARARLELVGPASCATAGDLAARVAARSPRIELVDDPAAITALATLTPRRAGGVEAELVLVESGARRPARRFLAHSCSEAADALALMVAVALDPVWVAEHGGTVDQPEEVAPPSASSPSSSAPDGSRPAPASSRPAPPPARPAPLPEEEPPAPPAPATEDLKAAPPTSPSTSPSPSPPWRRRISGQVAGFGLWGPAPSFMPGMAVSAVGALDTDGVVSPALALGALYAWRFDLEQPGGKASFELVAGSVDACGLRFRLSGAELRVCASAVLGRLSASGSDTDNPARVARPFVVAGAASLLTLPLGSRLELAARLGAGATWPRDSYELGTSVFYTSSRLTTSASLGLGARLW